MSSILLVGRRTLFSRFLPRIVANSLSASYCLPRTVIGSSCLIPHNTELLMTESAMTFREPSHINTVGAEVKTSRANFPLTQVQFQQANVLKRIPHLRTIFKRAQQGLSVLSCNAIYPRKTLMTFIITCLFLRTE